MHCWTPTSDLYVGCEEGHLLMVNGETLKVTLLTKIEDTVPKGEKLLYFIIPRSVPLVMVLHLKMGACSLFFSFSEPSLILSFLYPIVTRSRGCSSLLGLIDCSVL